MKQMSLHFGALALLFCNVYLVHLQEAPSQAKEDVTPSTNVSETTKDPRLTGDPRKDYIYDPNLPRELNDYDLSNYPFYTSVPTDITFRCDGRHDGYYASIPHHCQLFHLCVHSHRHDFLCANYTVFDQTQFICHFVNSVNCSVSEHYYDRNNELYVTTTTEPPEYEDEYDEEPRTKRPRRRKNKRRPKRRRTTTPPPDEYYDYYEEEDPVPQEYEDEPEETPRPPPKRTRTRTTTEAPTEEPTTKVNVPKVRRPQLRGPRPLAPPPAEPEDINVDAAAEAPVVADRPRRPFRGSPLPEEAVPDARPARQPAPPASDQAALAAERPFRGSPLAPPSEAAEPVRRPQRQRRPPPSEATGSIPVEAISVPRREPPKAAVGDAAAQSPPRRASGEDAIPVKRPFRQPPREVAQESTPLVGASSMADPTSVIAGILSGVGALPVAPPPLPTAPEPVAKDVDQERRGRRPIPSEAADAAASAVPLPAEVAGSQAPAAASGKRRVAKRRRKNRTTTTTTTTTAPPQAADYEYEYIE